MPFLKAWGKDGGQGGAAASSSLRWCDRRAVSVQHQPLGKAAGAEGGQEKPALKDGWEVCFAFPSVND